MSTVPLPSGGLSFGEYPQRVDARASPALRNAVRWIGAKARPRTGRSLPKQAARSLVLAKSRLRDADQRVLTDEIVAVSGCLRRYGLRADVAGRALALVSEIIWRVRDKRIYETQVQAAWLMLTGHLVEMATGEGKTLAAGLTAGVAALGGAPVHVLTANDYLVSRDRELLAPVFQALSLRSACVLSSMDAEARRRAWRNDVVYATAKELVFDYLRDHLALGGTRDARLLRAQAIEQNSDSPTSTQSIGHQPVVPGLCFCIVDEADSILLDEATVPLIISMPAPGMDVDGYRRAYEISAQLWRQRDYLVANSARSVVLTDAGRAYVSHAVRDATGVLWPERRACELVESALYARLIFGRDRDYAVCDGEVSLIDELTGRVSHGRRWQGALHSMVEIKEGIEPKPPTVRAAQLSYQRFFPRYLQVAGMSGTLLEARTQLDVVYQTPVVRVPLAKPSRREHQGNRIYRQASSKWRAVLASVRHKTNMGRPVLIGTDSVQASTELSEQLAHGGIVHQMLTATQDADEAGKIALAGQSAMVTVTTNMAGRGTDIDPDAQALSAGGLHVIATMCNRARRVDRQLAGRAARQGDPGSVEWIVALDDRLLTRNLPPWLLRLIGGVPMRDGRVPTLLGRPLFWLAQRCEEWRDRNLRRDLRLADRQARERFGFLGGTE